MRRATERVNIKRFVVVTGKRDKATATPVVGLQQLPCTDAYSADPGRAGSLQQSQIVSTPINARDIYVTGIHPIQRGDLAELNGETYTVQAVSKWLRGRTAVTQLTVELSLQ